MRDTEYSVSYPAFIAIELSSTSYPHLLAVEEKLWALRKSGKPKKAIKDKDSR
jgi:hypothetical protein